MRAYRFNLEPGPRPLILAFSLAVRLALLPIGLVRTIQESKIVGGER